MASYGMPQTGERSSIACFSDIYSHSSKPQMVQIYKEQIICNHQVRGSTPLAGTIFSIMSGLTKSDSNLTLTTQLGHRYYQFKIRYLTLSGLPSVGGKSASPLHSALFGATSGLAVTVGVRQTDGSD